jgi:DNA ligase-associated metallophosphoesterase
MTVELQAGIETSIGGVAAELRADGAVWFADDAMVVVSDLHLGKDASFRASGLPVPVGVNRTVLDLIDRAISATDCDCLVILGDMIHDRKSMTDKLVDQVADWRDKHRAIDVKLVVGNHDRRIKSFPRQWQLELCECFDLRGLAMVHEPEAGKRLGKSNYICGHLHPMVRTGKGADRMKVKCFAEFQDHLVLPAFGPFKGGMVLQQQKMTNCFAIADGHVWSVG